MATLESALEKISINEIGPLRQISRSAGAEDREYGLCKELGRVEG
ncbi:MAG: hypothetical protein ACKVOW_13900 [Chitinophagaceae bacterium]